MPADCGSTHVKYSSMTPFRNKFVLACVVGLSASACFASNMGTPNDWRRLFLLAGLVASLVIVGASAFVFFLLFRKWVINLRWPALIVPFAVFAAWLRRATAVAGGDLESLGFVLLPTLVGALPAFGWYLWYLNRISFGRRIKDQSAA